MRQQAIRGWRGVRAGSCRAWSLPTDETCARTARRLFKEAVAQLGLEHDILNDAVLMTSELAANTLHAHAAVQTSKPDGDNSQRPELWLYLRGLGLRRELVCKVFDCYRGWLHGPPPAPATIPADAASGHGLQIVHELSGGRWGHHLTRARLGGRGGRGKAVWFAVPAPFAHARLADVTGLRADTLSADVSAARRKVRISVRQAARELKAMLDERGLDTSAAKLVRSGEPAADLAVLAVRHGLTLWLRSGVVSLTGPDGFEERWSYADLVEASEQIIFLHEELASDRSQTLVNV